MRDAFGGAFMIKIFLVFIIVYVSFTALALNYAKAFKVKNKIIEYMESNEEVNFNNMNASELISMQDFFDKEIHGDMNYFGKVECRTSDIYCKDGIKIEEMGHGVNTKGSYYKVTTSFGWNLHFLNLIANFDGRNNGNPSFGNWKISGETRLIVNDND